MAINDIINYFLQAPKDMNFISIPECSTEFKKYYSMNPKFGKGYFSILISEGKFLILNANYTPNYHFEKISEIKQDYIEISKFYTTSSSYKVGKRNIKKVDKGIICFINTNKLVRVYCDKNRPIKFTKIILLKEYFDEFLKGRYGSYKDFKNAFKYLSHNPSSPKLNFIFDQIRSSKAKGIPQIIYMESKILEILSNVTHDHEENFKKQHIPVKLTKTDKRLLKKCEKYLKDNIGNYPTTSELSNIAKMSTSRFLLAFRQYFGTTPYKYLKNLRMNTSLTLLLNTEDSISLIAKELGYKNSGHFSGIFKSYYGITPNKYRMKNYTFYK